MVSFDDELTEAGLRCPICLDFYYDPLTLPSCGHTFCRLCLLQSTQLAPDGRSCPTCREKIVWPEKTLSTTGYGNKYVKDMGSRSSDDSFDLDDDTTWTGNTTGTPSDSRNNALTNKKRFPPDKQIEKKIWELLEKHAREQQSLTWSDQQCDDRRKRTPDSEEQCIDSLPLIPIPTVGRAVDILADRAQHDAVALRNFIEDNRKRMPIFFPFGAPEVEMGENAKNIGPGTTVSLHLFEPRYKILIRRAWEGDRTFVCTYRSPEWGMVGLMVYIESANFRNNGNADIKGKGLYRVKLEEIWEERFTEGLWYCRVKKTEIPYGAMPDEDGNYRLLAGEFSSDDQIVSSNRDNSDVVGNRDNDEIGGGFNIAHGGNLSTSSRRTRSSDPTLFVLRQTLIAAIGRGAPVYNRGDKKECAETYLYTAQELLRRFANEILDQEQPLTSIHPALLRLRRGVEEADILLRFRQPSLATMFLGVKKDRISNTTYDRVAWTLRHTFDQILDQDWGAYRSDLHRGAGSALNSNADNTNTSPSYRMPNTNTVAQMNTSQNTGSTNEPNRLSNRNANLLYPRTRNTVTPDTLSTLSDKLLPILFMNVDIRVGDIKQLTLFELRYQILAREVWDGLSTTSRNRPSQRESEANREPNTEREGIGDPANRDSRNENSISHRNSRNENRSSSSGILAVNGNLSAHTDRNSPNERETPANPNRETPTNRNPSPTNASASSSRDSANSPVEKFLLFSQKQPKMVSKEQTLLLAQMTACVWVANGRAVVELQALQQVNVKRVTCSAVKGDLFYGKIALPPESGVNRQRTSGNTCSCTIS